MVGTSVQLNSYIFLEKKFFKKIELYLQLNLEVNRGATMNTKAERLEF